ncbi:MAG TPA: FAD-dependent oxidoreductase, partial [Saprospiraceae bacterium]|nr:FAD-dependent oxidoreductase [Saprospiraceae bacterium]
MQFNIPDTQQPRVVIVGGGFGGLTLARKLARRDYQVVLVDKNNYHQFQ